ncbi:hypothetical protein GALL_415210 [mine drainage metagenome]|uniref:HTH crp-type domain-containing protein n=1 Tax=mine drainage metagenome TaxID=410659 RepID=A0A1J5Q0C1_9ZZZZ
MASIISSPNPSPNQNDILAALSSDDYQKLLPDLELVPMPLDLVLCEPGEKPKYAYFPVSAITCMLNVLRNDESVEIAVIGFDGFVGIALFMGGDRSPWRVVVQSPGFAYRIKATVLKREFRQNGNLRHLVMIYTLSLITQMAQTAVCNRHHSVVQQLCRWLLTTLDRLPSNKLNMTQGHIARMLGVRRVCITGAAGKLQEEGLIQYSRGNILVLDRPGLEKRVCECYAVVEKEASRLLSFRIRHPRHSLCHAKPVVRRVNFPQNSGQV